MLRYDDNSFAAGELGSDVLQLGNGSLTIPAMEFIKAYEANTLGVFGIGMPGLEVSAYTLTKPFQYRNFPIRLKDAGITNSVAYSLWLNGKYATTGSVIFGGVDTSKFIGPIVMIELVPTINNQILEFTVTATDVKYYTSPCDQYELFSNATMIALADVGSTSSYLPPPVVDGLAQKLNLTVDQDGDNVRSCKIHTDYNHFITIKISNYELKVPVSDLMLPKTDLQNNPLYYSNGDPICYLAVYPSPDLTFCSFGDNILRSTYLVFDLENKRLGISQSNLNPTDGELLEITAGLDGIPGSINGSYYVSPNICNGSIEETYNRSIDSTHSQTIEELTKHISTVAETFLNTGSKYHAVSSQTTTILLNVETLTSATSATTHYSQALSSSRQAPAAPYVSLSASLTTNLTSTIKAENISSTFTFDSDTVPLPSHIESFSLPKPIFSTTSVSASHELPYSSKSSNIISTSFRSDGYTDASQYIKASASSIASLSLSTGGVNPFPTSNQTAISFPVTSSSVIKYSAISGYNSKFTSSISPPAAYISIATDLPKALPTLSAPHAIASSPIAGNSTRSIQKTQYSLISGVTTILAKELPSSSLVSNTIDVNAIISSSSTISHLSASTHTLQHSQGTIQNPIDSLRSNSIIRPSSVYTFSKSELSSVYNLGPDMQIITYHSGSAVPHESLSETEAETESLDTEPNSSSLSIFTFSQPTSDTSREEYEHTTSEQTTVGGISYSRESISPNDLPQTSFYSSLSTVDIATPSLESHSTGEYFDPLELSSFPSETPSFGTLSSVIITVAFTGPDPYFTGTVSDKNSLNNVDYSELAPLPTKTELGSDSVVSSSLYGSLYGSSILTTGRPLESLGTDTASVTPPYLTQTQQALSSDPIVVPSTNQLSVSGTGPDSPFESTPPPDQVNKSSARTVSKTFMSALLITILVLSI